MNIDLMSEVNAPLAEGVEWLVKRGFETTLSPRGRICRDEVIMGKWVKLDENANILLVVEGGVSDEGQSWTVSTKLTNDTSLAPIMVSDKGVLSITESTPEHALIAMGAALERMAGMLPSLRAARAEYEKRITTITDSEVTSIMKELEEKN